MTETAVYDDVTLFNTIDRLLKASDDELSSDERRGCDRHSYPCIQLLAPYDDERLPGPGQFRQVRCLDLSPGGFSFTSYRPPESDWVIVALGTIPFIFIVAEIRHKNPIRTDEGQEFSVGCRFVKRLS